MPKSTLQFRGERVIHKFDVNALCTDHDPCGTVEGMMLSEGIDPTLTQEADA